ncbi:MAG TPA: PRTRC system ThiF family protein [Steroidobacteraceae bacterium]
MLRNRISIVVAGCGGTGSAVLSGLPYLHHALLAAGHPAGLQVYAADGDRVTETNCVRQPFTTSEIGMYKVHVLVQRLNVFWGLNWVALPTHVRCGRDLPDCDFLISCVDTRAARATLARIVRLKTRRFHYWLDGGNTADAGQFVLGEPLRPNRKERAMRLPCVDELFPQITKASLDRRDPLPACSAAQSLLCQEPFVNQTLAQHMLALLARLFRHGELWHHGGFLNLATGRVNPLPVDPAAWNRMLRHPRGSAAA